MGSNEVSLIIAFLSQLYIEAAFHGRRHIDPQADDKKSIWRSMANFDLSRSRPLSHMRCISIEGNMISVNYKLTNSSELKWYDILSLIQGEIVRGAVVYYQRQIHNTYWSLQCRYLFLDKRRYPQLLFWLYYVGSVECIRTLWYSNI